MVGSPWVAALFAVRGGLDKGCATATLQHKPGAQQRQHDDGDEAPTVPVRHQEKLHTCCKV